jgi:hypothetical protein
MSTPRAPGLANAAVFIAFALLGPLKAENLPDGVLSDIPKTASVAKWDLLYSWVDGSNQSLSLFSPYPTAAPPQIISPTWAPTRDSDPVVTGYGMRGAVGFVVPSGTFFRTDSDVRVQLKTSYVSASAAQSGDVSSTGSSFQPNAPNSIGCAGSVNCLGGLIAVDYHAWQAELKAASDMTFGPIVITPFVTFFAKNAESQQSAFDGVATSWSDLGGSFGIDSIIDITDHSLFGLRGSIGTAYRTTSFSSSQGGAQFFNEQSAMTADASGSPFLASGEANLIWKPKLGQTIKMFAGMQYDSRVPLAPGYGNYGAAPGAITFEASRIFYFGGSFKFDLDANPTRP